ncbi:MAG: bifunctional oligoribonuclease/PAP phosphatase NrnA [Fusobacteriaceae bacterium]|nr:bifunctional oligoribonuclease/PAP phosphatase NrnA [Fusobacteriaceae bacterium]
MKNNMKIFDDVLKKIKESENIIITSHVNPDGDAIGASLGLLLGLEKLFSDLNTTKHMRIVLQDKYPDTTNFLKYINKIEIYDENNKNYNCDLIIFVDSADIKRTGKIANLAKNVFTINFDHHITNPSFANLNYIKDISSTSEIIFKFLNFSEIEIDKDIAECLYTGLINDTGNFSHDNVTKDTFYMAGKLIEAGVNNSKIVSKFLKNKSYAAIKLIGESLFNMKFFKEKKLAYFYLPYEELQKYNGRKEDTENIVEKLIEYNEANVALFLREERDGVIKGSMRSKIDNIDVSQISGIFGGGGHKKAAGFSSSSTEKEILNEILKNL